MKATDSIMVGLVNAFMEEAYKKSLWKDGDLDRLFHKHRFTELAIMQLEWCLRFVRGEMEADDGQEQLLDDLLETRDQIQARLDEAELAVAEGDVRALRRRTRAPRRSGGGGERGRWSCILVTARADPAAARGAGADCCGGGGRRRVKKKQIGAYLGPVGDGAGRGIWLPRGSD
ncbi:hypothetical protein C2845_PM01G41120 [Panicum miliaceum]|uniref:Uncharacterized protein n=1 Tax=Panicum miliaceum TaxID=4540 RepID=A0A3L6TRZ7_PANMI|nr:hypothetical protein C2845_PM01G41120 [Panicum miliaceum]